MNYKILSIALAITLIGVLAYFLTRSRLLVVDISQERTSDFDKNSTALIIKGDSSNEISFTREDLKGIFDIPKFNKVVDLGKELTEELERKNKLLDSVKTGEPLTLYTASSRWRNFTEWNTRTGNFIREIKPNGFAFGKYRIRKMLKAIDEINKDIMKRGYCGTPDSIPAICDSLIYGVRLNLTFNKVPGNKDYIDALFTPYIKKEGKSYFPIKTYGTKENNNGMKMTGDDDPNDLLLNASIPCPNNCN